MQLHRLQICIAEVANLGHILDHFSCPASNVSMPAKCCICMSVSAQVWWFETCHLLQQQPVQHAFGMLCPALQALLTMNISAPAESLATSNSHVLYRCHYVSAASVAHREI